MGSVASGSACRKPLDQWMEATQPGRISPIDGVERSHQRPMQRTSHASRCSHRRPSREGAEILRRCKSDGSVKSCRQSATGNAASSYHLESPNQTIILEANLMIHLAHGDDAGRTDHCCRYPHSSIASHPTHLRQQSFPVSFPRRSGTALHRSIVTDDCPPVYPVVNRDSSPLSAKYVSIKCAAVESKNRQGRFSTKRVIPRPRIAPAAVHPRKTGMVKAYARPADRRLHDDSKAFRHSWRRCDAASLN